MTKIGIIRVAALAAFASLAFAGDGRASNLSFHGGPIMQTARSVVIFWLPPGSHYLSPPSNTAAQDTLYENTVKNFFGGLSGTSYLNINTQYIGQCGPSDCVAPANPGGVSLARVFTDLNPYPQSPLQDSDVQNEIKNLITENGLSFDLNTEFFVYTGAGVQECNGLTGCTSTDFCAYHSEFDFNNGKVVYAFMPNDNSLPGCGEGIGSGSPNQQAADQEVAATSHELFESITDPEPFGTALNILDPLGNTGWWDSDNIFSSSFGQEIGDKCNQIPATVTLGTRRFVVQQQWSNDSASCVSAFGTTIRLDVTTGSDDLRGDSSATAALLAPSGGTIQTVTLKSPAQSGWGNNSTHAVVTALRPGTLGTTTTPLGALAVTMASHASFPESGDNWNVQNLRVSLKTPSGAVFCSFNQGGDPLTRLTGSAPTARFSMPCPVPVVSPGPVFDTITFVVLTGGDDLRGDSSATAALNGTSGSAFQTVTLKAQNQSGWNNNSTHTVSANLASARPRSSFGSVVLRLTSHNGTFESDDNWNVQSVNISLTNSHTSDATCLANVGGNPFARLTGSGPTVTIGAGSGC